MIKMNYIPVVQVGREDPSIPVDRCPRTLRVLLWVPVVPVHSKLNHLHQIELSIGFKYR